MIKIVSLIIGIITFLLMATSHASSNVTKRIPQFSNDKAEAWETIIYPDKDQILKMHRHDHDRVLVALTDGVLKVTNNKGQSHLLKLEKEHAYYFTADISNEEHSDENISGHTIKTMVIELR